MRGWVIFLAILAVLCCFAILKVGIYLVYIEQEISVRFLIGPLKVQFPAKKDKEKKVRSDTKSIPRKKQRNIKPWLTALWEHLGEILDLVARILTSPTIDILKIDVSVGHSDPETCALNYGRICAVVASALALIENTFSIKKRKTDVRCCFDKTKTEVAAEAAVTLRIYEIVALAALFVRLGLKLYRQAKNTKKVGQNI